MYSAPKTSRRADAVSDDSDFCSEISAYLAATYYAYESGWYGADLLSALGGESYDFASFFSPRANERSFPVDRVARWNDVLAHLCQAPGCPADTCDTLTSHVGCYPLLGRMFDRLTKQWNGFDHAFTSVSASVYASEVSRARS